MYSEGGGAAHQRLQPAQAPCRASLDRAASRGVGAPAFDAEGRAPSPSIKVLILGGPPRGRPFVLPSAAPPLEHGRPGSGMPTGAASPRHAAGGARLIRPALARVSLRPDRSEERSWSRDEGQKGFLQGAESPSKAEAGCRTRSSPPPPPRGKPTSSSAPRGASARRAWRRLSVPRRSRLRRAPPVAGPGCPLPCGVVTPRFPWIRAHRPGMPDRRRVPARGLAGSLRLTSVRTWAMSNTGWRLADATPHPHRRAGRHRTWP